MVRLLDGGMGHLLKQGSIKIPGLPYEQQFLAGCLCNEAEPDAVRRAHAAYLLSGCTVITTNSFVATVHSLGKVQRQSDVCAIVSESYQTSGLPSPESMQQQYAAIAAALQPHVDVFLAETLSTVAEAHAALRAAASVAPGKPAWVSFTLEDSTACCLRDKQPLAAAVQELVAAQHANLAAVLVNCCAPAAATVAIPVLKQHAPPGVQVGCYANGFQTTTTQWLTGAQQALPDMHPGDYDAEGLITPEAYLRHARAWVAAGADYIGGCCGIGPAHMALLAQRLGRDQDEAAAEVATS